MLVQVGILLVACTSLAPVGIQHPLLPISCTVCFASCWPSLLAHRRDVPNNGLPKVALRKLFCIYIKKVDECREEGDTVKKKRRLSSSVKRFLWGMLYLMVAL